MIKSKSKYLSYGHSLPLLVEKGEDDFYVVECPLFEGCYSQGETIDEALRNIKEVIQLILEEKKVGIFLRVIVRKKLVFILLLFSNAKITDNFRQRSHWNFKQDRLQLCPPAW